MPANDCTIQEMPYTTPDEDPFHVPTMLDKWISDQHNSSHSSLTYDLVDDQDIPPQRTHKSSRHSLAPSFRAFRSTSNIDTPSRPFPRLSFFPRSPRSNINTPESSPHARSSSLSNLAPNTTTIQPTPSSSKWRPSVLGHFQHSSASQSSIGTSEALSRPSVSSGETYTTWNTSQTTTTLESSIPNPSKLSLFDSIRLRGNKSLSKHSSSSTRLPGPGESTEINDPTKSTSSVRIPNPGPAFDDEDDLDAPPTYRYIKHESSRPTIRHVSSGTLPRVKFASINSRSQKKKKKLIISGIGVAEVRKFENVMRWCESFGDVRQITRMPNGDLQIDFQDPEVADTVCRVRAKVFIAGVGSVQLSWVSGRKR